MGTRSPSSLVRFVCRAFGSLPAADLREGITRRERPCPHATPGTPPPAGQPRGRVAAVTPT